MCFFQVKMDCLLIIGIFVVLIKDSSHCTFRSVTSSFNASLMATFDKITEEECMSKCSMVLECTFMEYNEGTCKTFKYGIEVQELISPSRVFAYSFNEDKTSCPTATVSRPQTSTKKPAAVKKSISDICNGKYVLAEWEAVTLTSIEEDPDDLRTCLFAPSPTELNSCRMKIGVVRRWGLKPEKDGWMYHGNDKDPSEDDAIADYVYSVRPFACEKYSAESPYAVKQYSCIKNGKYDRYVAVIDIKGRPNYPFLAGYAELEQIDAIPFYVQKFEYV